jgi:hypothetical protein
MLGSLYALGVIELVERNHELVPWCECLTSDLCSRFNVTDGIGGDVQAKYFVECRIEERAFLDDVIGVHYAVAKGWGDFVLDGGLKVGVGEYVVKKLVGSCVDLSECVILGFRIVIVLMISEYLR